MTKAISANELNIYEKARLPIVAVAPMMDWTDRHCRFFHRRLTRRTLLYTEMVVADAVIHGARDRLLGFDETEHPVALQLGGSDPRKLAEAARIGEDFGYDEINLNVGCPSDRVQSGTFGACLMKEPGLVSECVAAMKGAVKVPVTVKCRIGVDEQDPEPPLDYDRVYRLKARKPNEFIGINGGVQTLEEARLHIQHVDGAMLGRAAYHTPGILAGVDAMLAGDAPGPFDFEALIDEMARYAARHIAEGGRLIHVTRHMVGLFHGLPGARRYRQILSTDATRQDAGPEVLKSALAAVNLDALAEEAA